MKTRARSNGLRTRRRGLSVITGGAGFIGTNLAIALLARNESVLLFDNLSRPGVERNLKWLEARFGQRARFQVGDVRDRESLSRAVEGATAVFHLAAQVAVTTSVAEPILDFEINAGGTLNLLEALRAVKHPPVLIFTSTNKVYGALPEVKLRTNTTRYLPADREVHEKGIGVDHPLDLHSPYGCSKGAADQYVLDYARVFGLPATVFRMSCIYGPHQFGTEDQGWVAHFLLRILERQPVTIYGDGMQVRDLLFVDDLVEALITARDHREIVSGRAYNIGGGPKNTASLLELIALVRELCGVEPDVRFDHWRPGDQKYYVSDTRQFQADTGWAPRVAVREGVHRLADWLSAHRLSSRSVKARRAG